MEQKPCGIVQQEDSENRTEPVPKRHHFSHHSWLQRQHYLNARSSFHLANTRHEMDDSFNPPTPHFHKLPLRTETVTQPRQLLLALPGTSCCEHHTNSRHQSSTLPSSSALCLLLNPTIFFPKFHLFLGKQFYSTHPSKGTGKNRTNVTNAVRAALPDGIFWTGRSIHSSRCS